MTRAEAVGDGLKVLAAVRGGSGEGAQQDVHGHGVDAGAELAAALVATMLGMFAVVVHHKLGDLVGVIVIVAVMVHVIAVDQSLEGLVTNPVVLERLNELVGRDPLLLKDELLDGGQRVGHGTEAHKLGAGEVEAGAAAGDVSAGLYAVMDQQREVGQRLEGLVRQVDGVDGRDHAVEPVLVLLVIGLEDLVKALHVAQVTGGRAKRLAGAVKALAVIDG